MLTDTNSFLSIPFGPICQITFVPFGINLTTKIANRFPLLFKDATELTLFVSEIEINVGLSHLRGLGVAALKEEDRYASGLITVRI